MQIHRNNRGVTLVFVALFLLLLLSFIGLATDAGWMVYVRNQGQTRVDAAALAGASALLAPAADRQAAVTARVGTFGDKNPVVNTSVTPSTSIDPLRYNQATGSLVSAPWGTAPPNDPNAVRVTSTIPTPLFFSGVRGVFGGSSEPSTNITVSAVGYLGCPGSCEPGTCDPRLPLAMCANYVGYPDNCGPTHALQAPNTTDNSGFTSFFDPSTSANDCRDLVNGTTPIPSVRVGDQINVTNGQDASCLSTIKTKFDLNKDASGKWCVFLPVVNCPSGSFTGVRAVAGFAQMCITQVVDTGSPKYVQGFLNCDVKVNDGPERGGGCFGVNETPILAQ